MGRRAGLYNDDDFDDYEDDDDYYEDGDGDYYDEYDETAAKPQAKPGPQGQKAGQAAPAAAAVKAGKAQPSKSSGAHPAAPQAGSSSSAAFKFDTPSPDDKVLKAQQGAIKRPGIALPTPSASLKAPSKPATKGTSSTTTSTSGGPATASGSRAVEQGVAALNLRDKDTAEAGPQSTAAAAAAASKVALQQRRRVADYVMEADLARELAAQQAKEGGGGGKAPLHLVVLGHVDAGKSTLMGRLLHDLGHVSQKEAHKNAKEAAQMGKASFSWAWVLDERPEERARGVTVDVAMSRFSTPRFNVTLLDAPGHRDFVPNMIGGAAQADAALLLVDGSPGGFEAGFQGAGPGGGGQTKEHAQLARSLGVEQIAVVISKLDTVDFSQERYEEVKAQLLPFLKSCGFKEASLQWLPAVGPLGENLAQPPKDARLAAWWKGPTVVQAVDGFQPRERNTGRPLRIPVSDVFRAKQGATTAGGKIEGGALKVGSQVVVVPSNETATVKGIEVDGKPAQFARAGDSVDVVLSGMDPANLAQGTVLCHPSFPVPLVTKFEARVVVLDVAIPILKGQAVVVHAHTARQSGHISGLLSVLDPKSGEVAKARPRCLIKGQTAMVEVTLDRSMCLEEFKDYKALGRVALRDGGKTVAVGIVTQVLE